MNIDSAPAWLCDMRVANDTPTDPTVLAAALEFILADGELGRPAEGTSAELHERWPEVSLDEMIDLYRLAAERRKAEAAILQRLLDTARRGGFAYDGEPVVAVVRRMAAGGDAEARTLLRHLPAEAELH